MILYLYRKCIKTLIVIKPGLFAKIEGDFITTYPREERFDWRIYAKIKQ